MIKMFRFMFLGTITWAFLFNCSESAVQVTNSGINNDTLFSWYPDSTDSSLIIFYDDNTEMFADFPENYRTLYIENCASCHADYLGIDTGGMPVTGGGIEPVINSWKDLVNYGAEKFYLAAAAGNMPPGSPVADQDLALVQGELSSLVSSSLNTNTFMTGFKDSNIKRVAEKFCGNCHGFNGIKIKKANLSTYDNWFALIDDVVYFVIEEEEMPNEGSDELILWQNDSLDKQILLDWIADGMPNETPTEY